MGLLEQWEQSGSGFLRAQAWKIRQEKAAQPVLTKAKLKAKERAALDDSDFAVPGKRKLPIHDEGHVRAAMGRFNQTKGLTPEEKATARERIGAAAKKLGIDTSEFDGQKSARAKVKKAKSVKAIHRLIVTPKSITKMATSEQPLLIIKSAPNFRIVSGVLTTEDIDMDGAISDYNWTKRAAQRWFDGGANLRMQHTRRLVGRGTALIPKDATRQLVLVSKVIDKKACRFLDEGMLTGYSWGARSSPENPIRVVKDQAAPGGRIVGGEWIEVSLCDRPSNRSARINIMPSEVA